MRDYPVAMYCTVRRIIFIDIDTSTSSNYSLMHLHLLLQHFITCSFLPGNFTLSLALTLTHPNSSMLSRNFQCDPKIDQKQ